MFTEIMVLELVSERYLDKTNLLQEESMGCFYSERCPWFKKA